MIKGPHLFILESPFANNHIFYSGPVSVFLLMDHVLFVDLLAPVLVQVIQCVFI